MSHKKIFIMPQMIDLDTQELSYETPIIRAELHGRRLSKQYMIVSFLEIFKHFNDISYIKVLFSCEQVLIEPSEFKPAFLKNIYECSIFPPETYEPLNDSDNSHISSHQALNNLTGFLAQQAQTYNQYYNEKTKYEVAYWMYKLAHIHHAPFTSCNTHEMPISITINPTFLNLLAQDCYKENYPAFLAQKLERDLPTQITASKTNKI